MHVLSKPSHTLLDSCWENSRGQNKSTSVLKELSLNDEG